MNVVLATALFCAASALPARAAALDLAQGPARGGAPVVVLPSSGPWAVVQLHVRTADADLTPAARAGLSDLAHALAQGALEGRRTTLADDLRAVGGAAEIRIDADALTVSWSAPAERLDVLLGTADAVLRGRARLLPAPSPAPFFAPPGDALDQAVLAIVAPAHPLSLPLRDEPVAGVAGAKDARALRALVDATLRKERLQLVVVGPAPGRADVPGTAADLLALVTRVVAAPVPANPRGGAPMRPVVLVDGARVVEVRGQSAETTSRALVCSTASVDDKGVAARAVLARLLDGRVRALAGVACLEQLLTLERARLAPRAEAARLDAIGAIARTPPPADLVEEARAKEAADQAARLTIPAALADAIGRSALLRGDPLAASRDLDALQAVTPGDVAAAAAAYATALRVVWRTLGGA